MCGTSTFQNSVKTKTRSKRGKGLRRRVEASNCLPKNWQQFLRDDSNKKELFAFLVKHLKHLATSTQLVTTQVAVLVAVCFCMILNYRATKGEVDQQIRWLLNYYVVIIL